MEKVTITNKHGESITLGNAAPYYLEILDGVGKYLLVLKAKNLLTKMVLLILTVCSRTGPSLLKE